MSALIKAKELRVGDIARLKPHPGFESSGGQADWHTVRRLVKTPASGGCIVSVYVEGFESSSWCCLRCSDSIQVQIHSETNI